MQPDFEKLFAQIPAAGQRMKRWMDRFDQSYKMLENQNIKRLRSEASRGQAAYQRAAFVLHQMAVEKAGLDELGNMYAFYDRLCLAYLNANAEQRERLRQSTSGLQWLSSGHYADSRAEKIRTTADIEPLRIALAAISIADWTFYPGSNAMIRADYPDSEPALAKLAEKSKQAGINIVPHLQAVAAISSEKPSRAAPNSLSMWAMMQNYANSLVQAGNPSVEMPRCPHISPLGSPSTLLTNAVSIDGQVTNATAIVAYRFVAKAGDRVTIDMLRSDDDLDTFLGLVDSKGNILIRSAGDDPRRARIADFAINATGCYYVYASRKGLGDGKTSGSFNLILSGASSFTLG